MELIIHAKKITSSKHNWELASKSFAVMHGVSSLGWCKNCNEEVRIGSASNKCEYTKFEKLHTWNGEDICIVSKQQKIDSINKCKKHMLKILHIATYPLDARQFQGETIVSAIAYNQLIDEEKIKIIDNIVCNT